MTRTFPELATRAALVVAACICAAPAVAHADDATNASDAQMAEARKQFQAGVNLLEDPDGAKYEDAYHAFRKAYELSHSPKVLGNIGFCALHLERDGEAIDAYSSYLREAPDVDERERAQIQRDLATLTSTAARMRVSVKRRSGTSVLVDTRVQTRGAAVENSYPLGSNELTIRMRPGRHTLKVKDAEGESVPFDVTIEPASDTVHEFVFPVKQADPGVRVIARESPSVAGPLTLGIAGILGLGLGATTGILAKNKTSSIAKSCPDDSCPATYDLEAQRDRAKTYGTIADVSFVAGGALLAGGLLWYVLLPSSKSASPSRAGRISPAAFCTGEGCSVQLSRGF